MFLDRVSNSWNYAKQSYGVLWEHKSLIAFPLVSLVAMGVIVMTFLFPLGVLEYITATAGSQPAESASGLGLIVLGGLFGVAMFFETAFFNAALIACTFQAIEGDEPEISHGFAVASKRVLSLLGWAAISSVVSSLLSSLEKHDRIGDIVSSILGMAWSAMTFFVIPVIVAEGRGPIAAIKKSTSILKETWGEALIGNFSIGILGFLLALPGGLMIVLGISSTPVGTAMVVFGGLWFILAVCIASAADAVFKALLYDYVTGVEVDSVIDTSDFDDAFTSRGGSW